jgi:pyruvate/2-oxoglutarate dehydrogenase complex dihydrolipoamide dehydrogenase (E3) component
MSSPGGSFEYDVAIIGGGSAGYAAGRTAAAAGLRTVVIEGGEEVGGLCILRGCMPTKALLYASEVMHLARTGATWGIHTEKVEPNFRAVMARKDAVIGEFARHRRSQLESGAFDFVRATARFTDAHTIALNKGTSLTAAHFIITSGSRVAPSPLSQLDEAGYLTSDSALKLEALPKSLIVLGGGAVAVEFGQFFARLGTKVTLIQRSPHVLNECDTDAAEALESAFRREGIELFTGTRLLNATRDANGKTVTFLHGEEKRHASADEMFFGLGRVPYTATLELNRAGVRTEWGRIVTNARMQTSASHIYAAGDCTGPYEIVHLAVQQGEIAAHNIAYPGQPREMDYRLLTEVVFTDPQVAVVGLTEKRARAAGIPYLTASYPFNDHGKSMIMDVKEGFVKLLAEPSTGAILGGCCVGPVGGELIHEIIAAMAKHMTTRELAAMPHYHPTLAEIWTYPAEEIAERVSGQPSVEPLKR